jgi:hypothetical protein
VSFFPTDESEPKVASALFPAGLLFGFFNALAGKITIGTPLVLFARLHQDI